MIIETNKDGEEIRLVLKGRLDSLSSDQLKNELLKCFMQGRSVIVDMESVEFISSAGLQALFVGQKAADSKNGKLLIINTNDAVADVFRVSGFYSILDVREG
ncbi:MAG: STAS domain-containing protein [Lachnospiraceae bacterium]|nr:STAS domain-containing protein [Lachnospiraceae bacterium]